MENGAWLLTAAADRSLFRDQLRLETTVGKSGIREQLGVLGVGIGGRRVYIYVE